MEWQVGQCIFLLRRFKSNSKIAGTGFIWDHNHWKINN